MENLILEWQKRQQKYEELAEKYKDDAHNNRKFTYKAMATRDCWKELSLQLQQTGVSTCFLEDYEDHFFEIKYKQVSCCKIAPITNENYCPNCGNKILK